MASCAPVGNRRWAGHWQASAGGLPTRRRLPTCPTGRHVPSPYLASLNSYSSPVERLRRRPYRPLEGPAANVVDLLLHGARERHNPYRDVDQILLVDLTVRQARLRQRRHYALLDLRTGPADGEGGQLLQIELGGVHATAAQVDLENLDAFLIHRQIHEEDLVETALANHLGGQQVDAVGGRRYEQAARFFLHPGEEERKDAALLAARFGRRDPHFDFVEPQHRRRHVFHHPASLDKRAFGFTVPAGKDLHHVHAIERKLETSGDGLHREALAAARDSHHEKPLGHDLVAQRVAHLKQFAPFQQPCLQAFESDRKS